MLRKFGISVLAAALPAFAMAAPVGVDGVIGSEWSGVTAAHVTYAAAAPSGDFANPTHTSNTTGYDVYLRRDANYLYAALQTTGPGDSGGNLFANLYFAVYDATFANRSTIGFEVTNDQAFKPGVTNVFYGDTAANLIDYATFQGTSLEADVIEVAFDLSIFQSNALGVAGYSFPSGSVPTTAVLFLSQSFGYSVAGDNSNVFLGASTVTAQVPEPASLALVGLGLLGLAATRKKRKA